MNVEENGVRQVFSPVSLSAEDTHSAADLAPDLKPEQPVVEQLGNWAQEAYTGKA
jgi:hypothetical protein